MKIVLSCNKGKRSVRWTLTEYVTKSVKADLICTSNYTHLVNHNFSCEVANNPKFASFTVLCLVSFVSNLYTYILPTEWVVCLQNCNIECVDKTCFYRPVKYSIGVEEIAHYKRWYLYFVLLHKYLHVSKYYCGFVWNYSTTGCV